MKLTEAFEVIREILRTLRDGQIILCVRGGQIKHINKTEEVFYQDVVTRF